jgi:hypothetical protein
METRNCQKCKKNFIIEPDDFLFYEKIKVPPPTFCPECRMIRRLLWRNERSLYKRSCVTESGEKVLISNYGSNVPFPVYEEGYWWGDTWDPMIYGQDFNFSKSFFEQFKELLAKVPQPHATNLQNTNSDFCNFTYQQKNCYYNSASDLNEDSAYLHRTLRSKNSFDLEGCENMESCISCYRSKDCYQTSYSFYSSNCIDSMLMWDCHNCQNCFGCVNLRNRSNCIFNEQYTKEEYQKKIQELRNGSYLTLQESLKRFFNETLKYPRKFGDIILSQNVTGNYIHHAKNCHNCFDVANKVEDCKFVSYAFNNTSQCYDVYAGGVNFELSYETMASGENAQRLFFSPMCWTSKDLYYSLLCQSSDCFGCIGLRNKQYCILNKQYTKEEYEAMIPKIKQHMMDMPYTDTLGLVYTYGEFFPTELSSFAYNETPAQDFYPKTKEEAIQQGFRWKDKEKNIHEVTMPHLQLPDRISDTPDTILEEIIGCEDAHTEYSPGAFHLIPTELALYRKLNLPLPRKSPQARYYDRQQFNLPMQLWLRECMCVQDKHDHSGKCSNQFNTSYAPFRPEIIYCESCYQKEVM